jgi:hypothetical protein
MRKGTPDILSPHAAAIMNSIPLLGDGELLAVARECRQEYNARSKALMAGFRKGHRVAVTMYDGKEREGVVRGIGNTKLYVLVREPNYTNVLRTFPSGQPRIAAHKAAWE